MTIATITNTKFFPIGVTATRGTTGALTLTYTPPTPVTIDTTNSVIIYQLISSPVGVMFWGLKITPSHQKDFLPPVLTAGYRMITLQDADTDTAPSTTYNVVLEMYDPDYGVVPSDPQIINRPGVTINDRIGAA